MIEISKNLYVGNIEDYYRLSTENEKWAFVHATQTVHYNIFGWNRTFNKPDKNHPNYIIWEKDNRLSLNWVDGDARLYAWSGVQTFTKVLDFIEKCIPERKVLIHCDQGISRSPTLGLLFLAKRLKSISNESYSKAYMDFINLYSLSQPSGIGQFVKENWEKIN